MVESNSESLTKTDGIILAIIFASRKLFIPIMLPKIFTIYLPNGFHCCFLSYINSNLTLITKFSCLMCSIKITLASVCLFIFVWISMVETEIRSNIDLTA